MPFLSVGAGLVTVMGYHFHKFKVYHRRDFTDILRSLISWLQGDQKGGYLVWGWLSQMSPFRGGWDLLEGRGRGGPWRPYNKTWWCCNIPSQQLARKWGLQSNTPQGPEHCQQLEEPGKGPWIRHQLTPWLQLCEILRRGPCHTTPTPDLQNCEIISYYFRGLGLCSFFMQWWETNVAINSQSQDSCLVLFDTRSFSLFHADTRSHIHSLHIPVLNLLLWLWAQDEQ